MLEELEARKQEEATQQQAVLQARRAQQAEAVKQMRTDRAQRRNTTSSRPSRLPRSSTASRRSHSPATSFRSQQLESNREAASWPADDHLTPSPESMIETQPGHQHQHTFEQENWAQHMRGASPRRVRSAKAHEINSTEARRQRILNQALEQVQQASSTGSAHSSRQAPIDSNNGGKASSAAIAEERSQHQTAHAFHDHDHDRRAAPARSLHQARQATNDDGGVSDDSLGEDEAGPRAAHDTDSLLSSLASQLQLSLRACRRMEQQHQHPAEDFVRLPASPLMTMEVESRATNYDALDKVAASVTVGSREQHPATHPASAATNRGVVRSSAGATASHYNLKSNHDLADITSSQLKPAEKGSVQSPAMINAGKYSTTAKRPADVQPHPTGTMVPSDEDIEAAASAFGLRAREDRHVPAHQASSFEHSRSQLDRLHRASSVAPGIVHRNMPGPGLTAWTTARSVAHDGHSSSQGASGPRVTRHQPGTAGPPVTLSVVESELKKEVSQLDERIKAVAQRLANRGLMSLAQLGAEDEVAPAQTSSSPRSHSARQLPRPPSYAPSVGSVGSSRARHISAPAAPRRRASRVSVATSEASSAHAGNHGAVVSTGGATVTDASAALRAMMAANARPPPPEPKARKPVYADSYLKRFSGKI